MKRLVTTLALGLIPFNGGIAQTQADSTSVPFQYVLVGNPAATQPVEFVIDTNTVGNWDTVRVAGEDVDLDGTRAGFISAPMPTEKQPVIYVGLSRTDVYSAGGGEDVLVLDKKNTLEFSAENTARAKLVRALVLYEATREETLQAYDLFPEHPKFAELVALYRQQKGLPADEATLEASGTLQGEIIVGVMNQLRQGGGLE